MMKIKDFIEKFKNDKVINTKIAPNAVSEYLKRELDIKPYIPFRVKREVAEVVVAQNISLVDGVVRHDSVDTYVSFIVASIATHTNLEFGDDPVEDYDILAENGLLPVIIAEFQESHNECEILLKMVLDMELEESNVNVLIGKFLNNLSNKLDSVGEILKNKLSDIDLKEFLDEDFKLKNLTNLSGFLDKFNK